MKSLSQSSWGIYFACPLSPGICNINKYFAFCVLSSLDPFFSRIWHQLAWTNWLEELCVYILIPAAKQSLGN